MKRLFIFIVALALSVSSSTRSASAQQAKDVRAGDIREAIVRYQIANWDLRADIYFVEIHSKDPDTAFLKRFADLAKPVRGKSASKSRKDVAGFHIEERRTKKRGVLFNQESISWLEDGTAEVEGGYVCASLCMAGGIYHLRFHDGRWIVTGYRINIQS